MSSSTLNDGGTNDYHQQQNQSSQVAVTAFLAKLWALVNDESSDDLIAWDPAGSSFHVYDQSRFAREILPRYFKHNKFASFIRQLNMYGFRKISTIEHGSLKNEHEDIEFAHPNFIRGQDVLLESIKRRAPDNQQKINIQTIKTETPATSSALVSTNYIDTKSTRSMEFSRLLDDVRNLQTKQTSLSDKLFHMQDENQVLWREVSLLKQKHTKQQQIVSKLMGFLIHFLTNSTETHRPSVEQKSKDSSIHPHHRQQSQPQPQQQQQHPQQQTHHQTLPNSQLITNNLKRKQAALMLSEEPKKRTINQQSQQIISQKITIPRPQGIIINELSDNDSGGWLHAAETSPLVDLVPSPPPPPSTIQISDENFIQQQNNYEWTVPNNELNSFDFSQDKSYQTIAHANCEADSNIPEFFLNTDNNNGTQKIVGQTHLLDINTSSKTLPIMKQEQIELPNTFHAHLPKSSTLNSSIYSDDKKNELIQSTNPSEIVPLSLDDITGDVDHIQTSLDNIRELMFDNLPDTTTIDDLFCDDHALLSPLLPSNDQTTNILTDNSQQSKTNSNINSISNSTSQCKQIILHKNENSSKISSIDVNHELLEQLINETAKVEKQRQTIHQLELDKINLEDQIHRLEQQKPNQKK